MTYPLEDIEAALNALGPDTVPDDTGFHMPATLNVKERHVTLFKLLRSQKARGISLDAALATCHIENTKAPHPLDRTELDKYLRRSWEQPDQPGFTTPVIDEVDPNELSRAAPSAPYTFEPAFGPDHFVSEWIAHFSTQCDASLEFFEASALLALSLATHAMCAYLSGAAEPLRTNLYMVFVGDAAASRKSTARSFLVAMAKLVPNLCGVLSEMASHEGTVEALSEQFSKSALWSIDELKPLLDKLTHATHLAGMLGLILELYSTTNYTYKRVSKRRKKKDDDHGERESDDFQIIDVTFSIIACCTTTIFEKLTTSAVESGLLPRFAIIWPSGKPERMPRFQLTASDRDTSAFVRRLNAIAARINAAAGVNDEGIVQNQPIASVRFADGVLDLLDREIDLPIEQDVEHGLMLTRMGVMAQKVAMLSAAGRPPTLADLEQRVITVTEADARSAIIVVRRWMDSSRRFEKSLNETAFEKTLKKCLDVVRGRDGHVNRREVARRVHVEAKLLREIETTLVQRDHIDVVSSKGPMGAPAFYWRWRR